MKRRQFITLLGGAAAAWPAAVRAQQPALPVVGYLNAQSPEALSHLVTAFRTGLSETGYVEGRNVAIEFRWAYDHSDRLPDLAADLVRRQVAVIVAVGNFAPALAAKAATSTIPIVFGIGTDPVKAGLAASFNRPGGNLTGITGLSGELAGKQVGLLHDLLPAAKRFAVLHNPKEPTADQFVKDVQAAATAMGQQIEFLAASTNREIDAAFASLGQMEAPALLVAADPLFLSRRVQLATLAVKYKVLAIYFVRDFPDVGGLMSYGPSFTEVNRQVGIYTGRVLKGAKPADLPVLQATKFEFVINLQTARLLGIEVPPGLLAIADDVIE
jgi:putative ABC transport system substrate-binding protein